MSASPSQRARATWTPERTADGSWTLRHLGLDEACHDASGAWTEACERFAAPCRLRERALAGAARLRVLDVGTGLGTNIAAALHAVGGTRTRLEVVTLEADPTVLAAALALRREVVDETPGAAARAAVGEALASAVDAGGAAVPLEGRGSLRLLFGDAAASAGALEPDAAFDAVFLDLFSPGRTPDAWGGGLARELARRMAPGSWLATYTAASGVRRALLEAGLRVGRGPHVGRKAEGTLASPDEEPPPLDARTAAKLARRVARGRRSP